MSSRSGRCGHGRSGGGQLGGLARHAPAGRAPAAHHTPPLSTRRSSRACACPGLASGKNQKCTLALLAVSSAQLRSCTLALCACCASVVSAISIAFSATHHHPCASCASVRVSVPDRNRALTCGPGFYLLSIPTLIDSEREGRFSASARYVFSQREMWSRAVGRGPAWRASPPCPGGARASGAPHAASQHQALQ